MEGRVTLEPFRGVAFVGGFSFADVLDSAKGWASVIKFNEGIAAQFTKFKARKVCVCVCMVCVLFVCVCLSLSLSLSHTLTHSHLIG
jgi:phosphoribosylformylglycinamidine synthase